MQITISDDFDLNKIIDSGQCFRAAQKEDGSCFFITGRHLLSIRPMDDHVFSCSCRKETWETVWVPYFDLDRSYRAIRQAISPDDSFLREASEMGAGLRILRQDPWETLVTFILSQRKSIPAIRTAVERLCSLAGTRVRWHGRDIYLFPSPAQLRRCSREDLASCGLGYRVPYVMDAAEKVSSGQISLSQLSLLPDEELLQALCAIKGVGIKVANCVALFAYGRLDLAPVDVWIRRVIDTVYGGVNPFPAYGDTAGLMQQYIFYRAIHERKK
jgi:N-glycosylase/DNA lyase